MSFQLNVSNSLKILATKLAEDLQKTNSGVFQLHYLITQTIGMNNWLKLSLSESMGILANCRFVKPNDIINQMYSWLGGEKKKIINNETMQWLIFSLLNDSNFINKFKSVADYYNNDSVKRMALAQKTADLFDQYQIYRPEMMKKWNVDKLNTLEDDEKWQQWLWENIKSSLGDEYIDRIAIHDYILSQLKINEQIKKLQEQLPHLNIFGVSIITRFHIQLFQALSEHINICFYILNPAPRQYWMDDITEKQIALCRQKNGNENEIVPNESGNALLMNLGKVIKDSFQLFFENDEFLNQFHEINPIEPSTETLLGKIQNDIYNNNDKSNRNKLSEKELYDGSLTINSCHTPAREVEVLYNYLSNLVNKSAENKKIVSTREIIVMVSDIDAYAPYIRAVFENAKYKFPITIADSSFTAENNFYTAVNELINLNHTIFNAEDVVQLLDSNYIRSRFGINNPSLIRTAVNMANIRCGIEGRKEDDTNLISFSHGLQKIIYGICLQGGEAFPVDGEEIYPLELIEGSGAYELIRFCHFLEVLMASVKERNENKSLSDWLIYLEDSIENLVCDSSDNEDEDMRLFSRQIEKLNLTSALAVEPISYEIFSKIITPLLTTETRSGAFASGGITFCSIIPMRSVPFKTVAMLGINFDKFPRKENPLGFNLMEKENHLGDRDTRENDKHLFIETILSASERLYISYIGNSNKDNSLIPPSSLIDELVDYIDSGIKPEIDVRKKLITKHPLHGFSSKYNKTEPSLYSYLSYNESNDIPDPKEKERNKNSKEVNLNKFISFFRNPFKYYYNHELGIDYETEGTVLSDTEPFELDNLQKWSVKNDLLQLDVDKIDAYRIKEVRTGALPLKNSAVVELLGLTDEIAGVKKIFDTERKGHLEDFKNITIELKDLKIIGKLNGLYGNKFISVSFSSQEYKYLLNAYIRYILSVVDGLNFEFIFISKTKGKAFKAKKMSVNQAKTHLSFLTKLFILGSQKVLAYHPELVSHEEAAEPDLNKLYKSIVEAFERYMYPISDAYLLKEYGNDYFKVDGITAEFQANFVAIHNSIAKVFPEYFE